MRKGGIMRLTIIAAVAAAFSATAFMAPAAAAPVVASGHQAGQCLDIRGGSNDAILWACHGGGNQQLNFRNGSYGQIMVAGRCLSTSGGAGTSLVVTQCRNAPAQRWANTSEGFLRNEEGWCADVERGGGQGSRVIAWQCNTNGRLAVNNQRWSFGQFYTASDLRNMGAGSLAQRVLGAATGSLVSGAGVVSVGGGNVVAVGGGNVIAAGGGNVVAVGGGNVIAPVAGVVAAGGLN